MLASWSWRCDNGHFTAGHEFKKVKFLFPPTRCTMMKTLMLRVRTRRRARGPELVTLTFATPRHA